jgi:agmatinase
MTTVNRHREPAYAGLATYCKAPLALTPEELEGVDVAIVGAPFDEGVSNRPGTRFGPRAIRQADNFPLSPPSRPHMALGIDPFAELTIVDYGDAECMPADLARSHAEIKARVGEILEAGAIPIVLGGDHSLAHPDMTAMAEHYGKGNVGVIHFDTHADTAPALWGVELSHGSPMRLVVDEGSIAGEHFIQVGLRGYFPDPPDWDWMRSAGLRWYSMYEIEDRGFNAVLDDLIATAKRDLPDQIFLSVDVDVLDPAHAPGTGTPEPGGLLPRELLRGIRRITAELPIAGMEVVEVLPAYDSGSVTALVAHRCVLEALGGIALRRTGREPQPQRDNRAAQPAATTTNGERSA